MRKGNQVLRAVSRRLSLPQELLPGEPLLELKGHTELCIQNHRGIRSYQEDSVTVGTKRGWVCVSGSGLHVLQMNRERITITGDVRALELGEGGA